MESISVEMIKLNDETIYIDLNDVLDILETQKKGHYTIIFINGEIWANVVMRKTVFNKMVKLKKKRGQLDG